MAKVPWLDEQQKDPTAQKIFADWLAKRPTVIKELVQRVSPDFIYRYRVTGQRGFVEGWVEDGRVIMIFPMEWNPWQSFSRKVYVKADYLQVADLLKVGETDDGDPELKFELECRCADCNVDTVQIDEFYMVLDDLWASATLNHPAQYLCIGCLETRLGRELHQNDFTPALCNLIGTDKSARWMDRLRRV